MDGLTNPLLDEINGLSPGAKAALQSAHNAGTSQATTQATMPNVISEQTNPPKFMGAQRQDLSSPAPDPSHLFSRAPMPILAPPNPGFAAARQSAQPSPAPSTDRMLPPSQESTVPSIGMGAPQPQVKAPLGTGTGDISERARLLNTGTGVHQIQDHPVLKAAAGVGDYLLSNLLPGPASQIPGTTAHHNFLLGQNTKQTATDLGNEQKQATTGATQAEIPLREAQTGATQAEIPLRQAQTEEAREKPDMAQAKLDQTQQLHDQQLREHGFKMDDQGKVVPLEYGEMSEPQQAVHDLKASQEELADAQTAFKKAQTSGIPAQLQMAQQRIQTAQQNARTAMGRLGISARSEEFREEQAKDKSENPAIPQVAQGRAYQGKAILESAQDLKGFIDKNPAVFGNLGSYWKQFTNNTPISDAAASKAMTKLASFAALQPALHGMRSHQAMQEFENMIGGIPKNGESLKAAIDGITESAAQPMIDVATPHHGAQPQGGGASPARPASVPEGYNFNPQGNGGKGSWQPPKQ